MVCIWHTRIDKVQTPQRMRQLAQHQSTDEVNRHALTSATANFCFSADHILRPATGTNNWGRQQDLIVSSGQPQIKSNRHCQRGTWAHEWSCHLLRQEHSFSDW